VTQGKPWLLDQAVPPDSDAIDRIEIDLESEALAYELLPRQTSLSSSTTSSTTPRSGLEEPDIRLDVLVVTAQSKTYKPNSFYQPRESGRLARAINPNQKMVSPPEST